MTRFRQEQGLSLIELLTAMSLATVVFGATLTLFVNFHSNERVNRLQNDAQDKAHNATNNMARQLRNLASPLDFRPDSVELATGTDFVFRTVEPLKPNNSLNDRSIKRVRYCLGQSSGGRAKLYAQQQTWNDPTPPPTLPSTATCPSSAWSSQQVVADDVVNAEPEYDEAIFGFTPQPTNQTTDELAKIRSVRLVLWTDANPGERPAATRLASGVFLRNQNRAPVASCTATAAANGQIILNASASEDPEGRGIREYVWFRGSSTPFNPELTGVVARWTAPAPGSYSFSVKVTDAGGLSATGFCDQPVVVP